MQPESGQRQEETSADSTDDFDFGNILFGGPCNQKCPFCIGLHLAPSLTSTSLRTPPSELKGLPEFIKQMQASGTTKVIFTGTSTDPQLYKYEADLQAVLREELGKDCHLSLHTNGLLAMKKLKIFNQYDSCTLSLNSLQPDIFRRMHGVRTMPDLATLLSVSEIPVKLSCVVNKENWEEVVGADGSFLPRCRDLGLRRVALRMVHTPMTARQVTAAGGDGQPHEEDGLGRRRLLEGKVFEGMSPVRFFRGNPVFDFGGMECTVWDFDHTESRSINLFPDGTISDKYLLGAAPQPQSPNHHIAQK
uniref:Radical SAM core domain-containing protein n=1 Tax=Rhizochromulina marina TaxID=1034831 RepID=A0A7S2WLJ0_9STRA